MKALIDGNITEISPERWAAFEAFEKSEAKKWPQNGDEYWYLATSGAVHSRRYKDEYAITHHSIGNIYRTESEALAQVEKLKAKARIDKYIRDNGLELKRDFDSRCWAVGLERKNTIVVQQFLYHYGLPYVFDSEAHAQQVIDNCNDDLKTLFGV